MFDKNIVIHKIDGKVENYYTTDSVVIECPSCGYSPICISCKESNIKDMTYKCPSCDMLHAISIIESI